MAPLTHKIARLKGALHSLNSVGCRPFGAVQNVGAVYGLDLIKSIAGMTAETGTVAPTIHSLSRAEPQSPEFVGTDDQARLFT